MKVLFTFEHASHERLVVPHALYLDIKKFKDRLIQIERLDSHHLTPELRDERTEMEKQIKLLTPKVPWCTDESPYGSAIATGILELPEAQGGKHPVKITIIEP